MTTVIFYVSQWPLGDRLLDSLKYRFDPTVDLRVDFTIHKSDCLERKITGFEVLGYTAEDASGSVKLRLKADSDIFYYGHNYRGDAPIDCWVNVLNPHQTGVMHLTAT